MWRTDGGKEGKKTKKTEEIGNCNVKISTRVKGSVVHSVHTKRVCSDIVKDCAGKSIFSAKALIDYSLWPDCPITGMIEPGLAGLLCLFNRREIPLGPAWQPECQLSAKESLMTAIAVSFIRFSLLVERGISHTSVKHPESISNTQVRGFCLLCPPPILHIKNGDWGCFLNQNPPTYKFPRWAGLQTIHVTPPLKKTKNGDFVWILKRLKNPVSLLF